MINFRDFIIGKEGRDEFIWAEHDDYVDYYLRKDGTIKRYLYHQQYDEENSGYFTCSKEFSNALSIYYNEPIDIFIPITEKIIL